MLNKIVIIQKHIEKKILKDYFLIEGKVDLDSSYFINKIIEGFREIENKSGKTNIEGLMTSFTYFNKDTEFLKIIKNLISYVDSEIKLNSYYLKNSWGFCTNKNEKTKYHNHESQMFSGVLYLNSHDLCLNFNEINKTIKPEKGKFVLFSSFLKHGTDVSYYEDTRWGISFDFSWVSFYDHK